MAISRWNMDGGVQTCTIWSSFLTDSAGGDDVWGVFSAAGELAGSLREVLEPARRRPVVAGASL
jgi:hypothetical protein